MDKIIDLIDVLPPTMVASDQPGLSSSRVQVIVKAFYSNVFSTVVLSSVVEKLIDPELRSKCRVKIANAIALEYEKVF